MEGRWEETSCLIKLIKEALCGEGRGFVDMWRPLVDLSLSELALTEWMRCGCVNACLNLRVMWQRLSVRFSK